MEPKQIDFSNFQNWSPDEIKFSGWESYEVDLGKDYPPVQFLIEHKGIGIFPRAELVAVAGKAKSCKSFMLSIMSAVLLNGELGDFKAVRQGVGILYCDTEMGASNVVGRARTTLKLAGLDPRASNPLYRVLSLRELSPSERFDKIETAIKDLSPDFVIIDGVVDLLDDFNDITQSKACINRLLRLSSQYQCTTASVLHENKGALDTNMRGHLGTELTNKCSEVYALKRDASADQYKVEQTLCRNKPAEAWSFSINPQGVPEFAIPETPISKTALSDRGETNALTDVLPTGTTTTYTALINNYRERKACGKSTAEKHISKWLERGVLKKVGDLYKIEIAGNYL